MAFFWALNYVMVKFAYAYDLSSSILLMRVLYASIFSSLIFIRQIKLPKSPLEHLKVFILANLNITGFFSLWFFGETGVSAAVTSIVIYSYPILATAFSYLFLGDRFGAMKTLGLILGFAGLVIIFIRSINVENLVDLIMLLVAAISWAIGTVFYRKYLLGYDSAGLNTLQLLYALPVVLLISLFTGGINIGLLQLKFNLIMIYMGSFGTAIAYFIYLYLYRKYKVSSISAYFFLVPAISVVLAAVLLKEPISALTIAGFAVMSAGIFLSGSFK
ncbi:hypothetical protein [Thermoplasma volcanium GSS1]|uniref:EamA domain-containing protein n=2 Tax=Thermoplasma volcanium TaxID=50339 RepID=Q978L6_THEVO|nr:hypothetical protein [Thermoplasma volcanium GSS1]